MSAAESHPSRAAILAAFATVYLVWGSTYLAIRVAVETMPPFLMAGVRFIIAGSILFVVVRLRGGARPTSRQWAMNGVIGTLLLLGGNGLVVWAEQTIASGTAALLVGATPLFIALTEWLWPGGIRPPLSTWLALGVGFVGIAWLTSPWEAGADSFDPRGVIALLLASVLWSIGSIYSRHATDNAEPFLASALQMLTGGASLLFVAGWHGDLAALDFARITAGAWVAFFYLILFGSLLGFSAFVWLMKHCRPAQVATYAYVNPVVAVILGWVLLGETVNARMLGAAAVILIAVALVSLDKKPAAYVKRSR